MLDSAYEIFMGVAGESIFDGVFGLQITPPPLDRAGWEEWCEEHGGVMSVEEAQAEYQEYLKGELVRLREEIDILLAEIDRQIEDTNDPRLRKELQAFKKELYYAELDEQGKIEVEYGLRADITSSIWALERYSFETKELVYLKKDTINGREEWVEKISKMSPESFLTEVYYPTTKRLLITLPDLGDRRLTA